VACPAMGCAAAPIFAAAARQIAGQATLLRLRQKPDPAELAPTLTIRHKKARKKCGLFVAQDLQVFNGTNLVFVDAGFFTVQLFELVET
jgi:hypothetical protein